MLQMHLVYSSELGVYVYSAAQVKKAMEVGICVHVKCDFCVHNLCLQCFSTTFKVCLLTNFAGHTLFRRRELCVLGWP